MSVADITVSDALALAALCVAILAIVLAPLARRVSRTRTEVKELAARLQDTERRLSTLAALTGRGFANTHSALAFAHGVLDRARSGRLPEVDQQQLSEQLAQMRRGVERAWAEANLLSDDPALRTSAYEQLNGRLADRDTAEVKRTSGPPTG
jgi:type II secretory pathway pseudopilin PulG